MNSEELIYFQISEVPCLNSQTQFVITFTIEIDVVKLWLLLSLGSPSSEVCCFDRKYSGVIGILPDKLSDYSVGSAC